MISSIRDEDSEKKRIAKGRVIDELIQTEMDYYKVMKLLYDVYLGPNSENTVSSSWLNHILTLRPQDP